MILVLVSHGGLAEGLGSSLAMLLVIRWIRSCQLKLKEGKSVDDFAVDFRRAFQD